MSDKLLVAYFEMMHSEQGEKECPKMMYYSTTGSALYILHQTHDLDPYIKVSVVCKLGVEVFKLKSATSMVGTFDIFKSFLNLHINRFYGKEDAYKELLFKK